jgi:serine/threonine-protein kinase RsbW
MRDRALKGAGHVLSYFKYIGEPEKYKVFCPPRHTDMLEGIYGVLGVRRSFGSAKGLKAAPLLDESSLQLSIKPFHRTATIEVRGYGADIAKRIEAKLVELQNKGFNALYLELPLKDPYTASATGRLEELGFFFSGLLPDYSDGDILRLQYYNTEVVYDEIGTCSPFASELVNYIKSLDPKWRALKS